MRQVLAQVTVKGDVKSTAGQRLRYITTGGGEPSRHRPRTIPWPTPSSAKPVDLDAEVWGLFLMYLSRNLHTTTRTTDCIVRRQPLSPARTSIGRCQPTYQVLMICVSVVMHGQLGRVRADKQQHVHSCYLLYVLWFRCIVRSTFESFVHSVSCILRW